MVSIDHAYLEKGWSGGESHVLTLLCFWLKAAASCLKSVNSSVQTAFALWPIVIQ